MHLIDQDIARIAGALGVEVKALLGRGRSADLATARAVCYRLLLERGHSGPLVAHAFGRDHSTIYQMRDRIVARVMVDSRLKSLTAEARKAMLDGSGRICKACGKPKPEADFYKSRPRTCKACVKAASVNRVKAMREADPDAVRAYDRHKMRRYNQRKREEQRHVGAD